MNLVNRLRSTEVSSRTAVIAVLAVVLVTAGGATLIVRALTEPAVEPLELTTPTSKASPATTPATSGLPEQGDSPIMGQAYDLIVQRGLFQPSPVALAPEAPLPALIEFDLPEPLMAGVCSFGVLHWNCGDYRPSLRPAGKRRTRDRRIRAGGGRGPGVPSVGDWRRLCGGGVRWRDF